MQVRRLPMLHPTRLLIPSSARRRRRVLVLMDDERVGVRLAAVHHVQTNDVSKDKCDPNIPVGEGRRESKTKKETFLLQLLFRHKDGGVSHQKTVST